MSSLIPDFNKLLPPIPRPSAEYRKRLQWLMLLRLLVTSFLLLLTLFLQSNASDTFFSDPAAPLYVILGAVFLLSLLYALALPKISNLQAFAILQIVIDSVYATALIKFTGGASSTFALIYVLPIIAASILYSKRGALWLASVSCLLLGLLITLEFYRLIPESPWPWVGPWSNYDLNFVLWFLIVHFTIFFFVAIIAGTVAEQLKSAKISLSLREMAFEKLSELHTNIVQSVSTGIITTDQANRVTFVNQAGTSILGISLASLLHFPVARIFPEMSQDDSEDSIRKLTHVHISTVQGEARIIEYTVTDLKDISGEPSGRLVVFQDVTQLRTMEERAKRNEQRDAFVRIAAGMAHEIRNPLASLRGAAELLSSQQLSDMTHKQRLLSIVIRESDKLNSLLNDFIVTVNSRQNHERRLSLDRLVEENANLFTREVCASRGISVEKTICSDLEVTGQPERLRQAVWNLMANAAEASPDGSVIRVLLARDADEAVLTIVDSGSGILPAMRERLFEPFASTKEFGTGLGLPLVLSVVKAHKGTIEVKSDENRGAVFAVRLPLATSGIAANGGGADNA